MDLNYYVLVVSLRKKTDRGHFDNPDVAHGGTNYFNKEELVDKLEFNNICVQQLYENDFGIIKDNLLLVQVQKGDLEDRMKELIDKSIFMILMKTGKPEF